MKAKSASKQTNKQTALSNYSFYKNNFNCYRNYSVKYNCYGRLESLRRTGVFPLLEHSLHLLKQVAVADNAPF
jgi:hypothetical protein